MNVLILDTPQWLSATTAISSPRQTDHIRKILKRTVGDRLQVGQLNGDLGEGKIVEDKHTHFVIGDIALNKTAPATLPITLILGMPRPQMLKRILQTVATMGVEHLCFLQTSRVEKSFWQSPSASAQAIHEQLLIGLEQGVATQLPQVTCFKRFRPFIEDELSALSEGKIKLIADPAGRSIPGEYSLQDKIVLAIGPEGGFIEKEVKRFEECGFTSIHLGRRILKVETAVPVLLSKLYAFSLD